MATTDDIERHINGLNETAKSKEKDKNLKEKLAEFITFDVDAKQ